MGRREEEARPLTWSVAFTARADRDFDRLPQQVRKRFAKAIDRLREDPFRPRPGVDVKPLSATDGLYRLRVGRFRGVYEVVLVIRAGTIVFTRFEHRKRAYR